MRRHTSGGFWICFLFTMLLNFELAIPGVILLVLRIWLPIPLWVALLVLSLWVLIPLVMTLALTILTGLAGKETTPNIENRSKEQEEKHRKSQELLGKGQNQSN